MEEAEKFYLDLRTAASDVPPQNFFQILEENFTARLEPEEAPFTDHNGKYLATLLTEHELVDLLPDGNM